MKTRSAALLGILLTAAPTLRAAQTMRAEVNAKSHVIAVGIDPRTGTLFGGADVRGERAIAGF